MEECNPPFFFPPYRGGLYIFYLSLFRCQEWLFLNGFVLAILWVSSSARRMRSLLLCTDYLLYMSFFLDRTIFFNHSVHSTIEFTLSSTLDVYYSYLSTGIFAIHHDLHRLCCKTRCVTTNASITNIPNTMTP
jgi:hypothetical protein